MPYITKLTPSAYYNRHTDWYRGWFKEICHAYGTIGANLFYYDCENKASFAKSLCNAIPLVGGAIGDFFVSIFRGVYNARYVAVYDDWAVAACKIFENFQGKIEQTYKDIETAVNNAKAYIKTNLIDPMQKYLDNTLKPQFADAQSKINSMRSQLSGFDTRIQSLVGNVDSLTNSLKGFDTKLQSYQTSLNNLTSKAQNLDTKIQDLTSNFNTLSTFADSINASLKDAQDKLTKYKELIDALDKRVLALEGKKPEEKAEISFPQFTVPEFLRT